MVLKPFRFCSTLLARLDASEAVFATCVNVALFESAVDFTVLTVCTVESNVLTVSDSFEDNALAVCSTEDALPIAPEAVLATSATLPVISFAFCVKAEFVA